MNTGDMIFAMVMSEPKPLFLQFTERNEMDFPVSSTTKEYANKKNTVAVLKEIEKEEMNTTYGSATLSPELKKEYDDKRFFDKLIVRRSEAEQKALAIAEEIKQILNKHKVYYEVSEVMGPHLKFIKFGEVKIKV